MVRSLGEVVGVKWLLMARLYRREEFLPTRRPLEVLCPSELFLLRWPLTDHFIRVAGNSRYAQMGHSLQVLDVFLSPMGVSLGSNPWGRLLTLRTIS